MEDNLKLVHGYDGKTKYTGIEKYIFYDVYNFFLKYRFTENNSYNWEHLTADAKILAFKYHDYALAQDLTTAAVAQLEFNYVIRLANHVRRIMDFPNISLQSIVVNHIPQTIRRGQLLS